MSLIIDDAWLGACVWGKSDDPNKLWPRINLDVPQEPEEWMALHYLFDQNASSLNDFMAGVLAHTGFGDDGAGYSYPGDFEPGELEPDEVFDGGVLIMDAMDNEVVVSQGSFDRAVLHYAELIAADARDNGLPVLGLPWWSDFEAQIEALRARVEGA